MRVLLDTDVILDLLLDRSPFVEDAAALQKANEEGRLEIYISAITPVNVFYIARKLKGTEMARKAVQELLMGLHILHLDEVVLRTALNLPLKDYEDAVQHASASANQIDIIVTRNIPDYQGATIPVALPKDFLKSFENKNP